MNKKIFIILAIVIIAGIGWFAYRAYTQPDQQNVDTGSSMEIISRDVTYDGITRGFLVEPKEQGNYPGIIMIHEWWGLNDHIEEKAEELAHQGYYVLAVDLYGGKVAATTSEAMQYRNAVVPAEALANLKSAKAYLLEKGATKVASLGWCFGGGQSLALGLSGEALDANVIYYGTPLITDQTQLANITSPVLGIFGDQDTSIPVATVNAFDASLDAVGIENEIHIYPGVGHAFANPSGMNFASEPARDAWTKTLEFLETHLKSA